MQIGLNTTGFPAAISVAIDKDGRDWCVVVVKGTFAIAPDGTARPAEAMVPPTTCDEHFGDPATTAIRYECDFARCKPKVDVLLVGHAVPPRGRPVAELDVSFEIGTVRKSIHVTGDRVWQSSVAGVRASAPTPFESMPLEYGRAFGGIDSSDPKKVAAELRNLAGVGFYRNTESRNLVGKPLPNMEDPHHRYRSPTDTPPPAGFGVVGRGWQPRVKFAGTYDQIWRDERCPFLPADFDERYFQMAPADQQLPQLLGGERVICTNVRAEGPFAATVPTLDVPVSFHFRDRQQDQTGRLDTLIVEPEHRRLILVWRAQVAFGRKLTALREVTIGPRPLVRPAGLTEKRHFGSLKDLPTAKREKVL